jgi:[lysine-biosynthesis-protein LysW]---L-2-aminoadipate ligase
VGGLVIVAERGTGTNRLLAGAFRDARVPVRRMGGAQLRAARLLGRLDGVVLLGRADVSRRLDGVGDAFWELRRLESDGLQVLNGTRTLLRCHDKLQTALQLRRAGLPHPRTALLGDPETAPLFGGPYVVKPRFGSWGLDVERCQDAEELRTCLRQLARRRWFRRQGVLVQEFVPNQAVDLRLVVAAGQVVGAIERVAAAGEWRTNIALGGTRRPVEPPPAACALAQAAAAAVEADLVGVDVLPLADGGYTVIELNGAVDFDRSYGENVFARVAGLLVPNAAPGLLTRQEVSLPLAGVLAESRFDAAARR